MIPYIKAEPALISQIKSAILARKETLRKPMCKIIGTHVYAPLDDTCIHCQVNMPKRRK